MTIREDASLEQKLVKIFGSNTNKRERECYNRIIKLGNGNDVILVDYVQAYKRDNPGIATSTLTMYLLNLVRFAESINKPFADMTSDDVLRYTDGFRKSEADDPPQRWRGMYNLFKIIITCFFKWFYAPDISSEDRPKPTIVANLKTAKPKGGKKRKRYGPNDMWTIIDNEIFFKYCPDARIIGYHSLAVDVGARPHELLGLKIEDIIWPPDGQPPRLSLISPHITAEYIRKCEHSSTILVALFSNERIVWLLCVDFPIDEVAMKHADYNIEKAKAENAAKWGYKVGVVVLIPDFVTLIITMIVIKLTGTLVR